MSILLVHIIGPRNVGSIIKEGGGAHSLKGALAEFLDVILST